MSGWDAEQVSFSRDVRVNTQDSLAPEIIDRNQATRQFREFIRGYRDEHGSFIYRERLLQQWQTGGPIALEVDLAHLGGFNEQLLDILQRHPADNLPLFEQAAKDSLALLREGEAAVPACQILLRSDQRSTRIRDVNAADVNRLLRVPGIVISASRARPKATSLALRCTSCQAPTTIPIHGAFGVAQLPRQCTASAADGGQRGSERCPLDPYVIEPDRCHYVDQQTLKLQEAPEEVPTGEMPRHMLLAVDRAIVDRVSPGTRVSVLGVASVFNSASRRDAGGLSIRTPYLRVAGLEVQNRANGRSEASFTPKEEEAFRKLASDDIYAKLHASIAPSISGDYTDDIKRAIACMLVGGSRKVLPDGMRIRGDLNVLLLGDPSTAKSQFLKFAERVAPVGVYTSGKGSSAAGLTASVVRDARGEFFLEGGAMVLADGGVVCIDEFDKMRESDRVAIHEAMEQQTISIAKAGITTVLNSRCAVLAAANPIFGRYDDSKAAAENIDFLPSILSRFDLIFIVRDVRDEDRDKAIARHVMEVHIQASEGTSVEVGEEGEIDLETMRKYISYCRSRCAPRLTRAAASKLGNEYVQIRQSSKRGGERSVVPITVRQLEAIVRVSEALAKMELAVDVSPHHVEEALRLFKTSTMAAVHHGEDGPWEGAFGVYGAEEVQRAEGWLNAHIPVHDRASVRALRKMFSSVSGMDVGVLDRALQLLVRRGDYAFKQRRQLVERAR